MALSDYFEQNSNALGPEGSTQSAEAGFDPAEIAVNEKQIDEKQASATASEEALIGGTVDTIVGVPDSLEGPAPVDPQKSDDRTPIKYEESGPSGPEQESSTEPQFDPVMLDAAGMTKEQALKESFTPQILESLVSRLDASYISDGDKLHGQQVQPQYRQDQPNQYTTQHPGQPPQPAAYPWPQQVPQQAPQQSPQQVPQQAPQQLQQPAEFKLPESSEGWTDETQKLAQLFSDFHKNQFDTYRQQFDQRIGEQQQALSQMNEDRINEQRNQEFQAFEEFVDSLGKEWSSVFGTGSGLEMNRGSLHFQNRMQLYDTAAKLASGIRNRGMNTPHLKSLLHRAVHASFPQQSEQNLRTEIGKELTGRQNLITSRPTSRQSNEKTGVQKAVDAEKEFMKKYQLDEEYVSRLDVV